MTTGPPLYLVSACNSAEEFVAAFRRYADRTGLFVPSAQPLPAGRRGRLAITLRDGGVMIEGEAEILQSSAKPTVLHGRPGMTVKFVEPDELSKVVIGELEKARLAMKPAPSTVPPRPADVPAEPRPVPPPPGGRIDAANALAECVVIGDVSSLEVTASSPKSPLDSKFVVPSIPAVGAPRPKSPSTPPELKPPAPPPERAKTPTAPPNPASTAVPAPPPRPAPDKSRMTSIGFPAIDKLPAKSESGSVPAIAPKTDSGSVRAIAPKADSGRVPAMAPKADSGRVATPASTTGSGRVGTAAPMSGSGRVVSNATTLGMPAIDRKPDAPPSPLAASQAALESKLGSAPGRGDATPQRFFHTATVPGTPVAHTPVASDEETTTIGTGPPKQPSEPPMSAAAAPASNGLGDDDATAIGEAPVKKTTDPMPTAAPIAAGPTGNGPRADAKVDKKTSIGFPAMRTPFETQPLGLVQSAAVAASPSGPASAPAKAPDVPGDPAPPTLPKSARPAPPQGPRTKSPTAPPGRVRVATPASPLPVVRMPAKPAPVFGAEDEKTDLGQAPTVNANPVEPNASPGSGGIVKAVEPRAAARSGGMRASEIMAAIPSGDWTMSPDESMPHALPPEEKVTAPPSEPTPAPGPPPGPPTGDFIIALDPETGWGEPEKLAKPRTESPASGNPVITVASDKPINVVQWDDKPTGIGESKIEIDSTLMEPHKPMPELDATAQQQAIPSPPPPRTPTSESRPLDVVPPPLAPMPARPTSGFAMAGAQFPVQRPSVTDIVGYPPMAPVDPAAKRKKMILLAVVAGLVAVGAIVMLVLTLGGKKASSPAVDPGSGSAPSKIVTPAKTTPPAPTPETPPKGSATAPAGSGSQQASTEPKGSAQETPPPGKGSAAAPPPPPSGPCKVQVVSSPLGADIYLDDQKLGTAPATIELPCGSESKVTLKKKSFPNTLRSFTPDANKPNKLVVKLNRTMVSVKVTSTPAGATITAGGKTMGVTPTTIKLPAGEATTITLTKPGFAADTEKVTPKGNNTPHHVTLKKGKR